MIGWPTPPRYAGQAGVLQLTKPWLPTNFDDGALPDNIQFSSSPVPEPGALSLLIGGLCLIYYRVTRPGKFLKPSAGGAFNSAARSKRRIGVGSVPGHEGRTGKVASRRWSCFV